MSLVQSILATAEREAILEMKVDGLPENWQLTSTSFDSDDLKARGLLPVKFGKVRLGRQLSVM